MATVEELKEMIVNLKVWLRESYIPHGNCPYCYFSVEGSTRECGSIDCDLCRKEYFYLYRQQVKREVENL